MVEKQINENANISEVLQLVTFMLGDEEFGANILNVREIKKWENVTHVPKAPSFVEGVMNLRGQIIPVIDLRRRFGMDDVERTNETRIIVVDLKGKLIGFIVDSVSKVERIQKSLIDPPPPIVAGISDEYIIGVARLEDTLLIVLDLDKILTTKEQEELQSNM